MNFLLTLLTMLSASPIEGPPTEPETRLEAAILDEAMECPGRNPDRAAHRDVLLAVLRLERDHGVPLRMRGMSLAAACVESKLDPSAKGDKRGKTWKAIGLFQQWPCMTLAYGTRRNDPISAADGWIGHVARQVKPVIRRCGDRGVRRNWITAWVTGIRAPRKGGRCNQEPKHLKLFDAWRDHWQAELADQS